MKDPTFLLQLNGPLITERLACVFSSYASTSTTYGSIGKLDPQASRTKLIPVGSVEFVKSYSSHVGIVLPEDFSYGIFDGQLDKFLMRSVRRGTYGEATPDSFVKPVSVKSFTGDIKKNLELCDCVPVWTSEPVPFGAEFRFYICDNTVLGWSRYDDLSTHYPDPDIELVQAVIDKMRGVDAPVAYTVDIGWRPDLNCYCLVELNDAWALGFYENTDPQSNPPTRQQYADMLIRRWTQIVKS